MILTKEEAINEAHDYFYGKHVFSKGMFINARIEKKEDGYIIIDNQNNQLKTKKEWKIR